MNSLYVNLVRRIFFFSYKFSVQKNVYWWPQNPLRMHHFDAISQKISGGGPRAPTCGRGWPLPPNLPLSALRASVKPSASFVPCAPPGSGGSGSAPDYKHGYFGFDFYTVRWFGSTSTKVALKYSGPVDRGQKWLARSFYFYQQKHEILQSTIVYKYTDDSKRRN